MSSVPRDGVLVHWPIKDGPVPEPETLRGVASLVAGCLRGGAIVYVHCQAGLNRSALVAGRILMEQGMSAERAIETVRERRRGSLSDEYANWLRSEEQGLRAEVTRDVPDEPRTVHGAGAAEPAPS